MSNKTDIKEDIKKLERVIELAKQTGVDKTLAQAIENILADRERILEDKEILEDNYKILNENISMIAKELNLKEDATIDEIYTAIKILKSKRLNMFEQLECNEKAKKYDKLIEKIKNKIGYIKEEGYWEFTTDRDSDKCEQFLQEILDTEQEKK